MGPMLYYDDENDDYDNTRIQKFSKYSKNQQNKLSHEHLEKSFYQINNNNNYNLNNAELKCEQKIRCYSNSFTNVFNKNSSEKCNNIYNEERHCKMKDSLTFTSSKSINSNIYSTPIDTTTTTNITTTTTTTTTNATTTTTMNNLNNNNTDIPILSTDVPLLNIVESDIKELSMKIKDLDNSVSLQNENESSSSSSSSLSTSSVTSNISYLSHMPRKLLMKLVSSLFSTTTKTDDNADSLQLSGSLSSFSSISTLLSSSIQNLVSSLDSSEEATKNDAMTTNSTSAAAASTATATATATATTTTITSMSSSPSPSPSSSTSSASVSSSSSSSLPTIDSSQICDIMNRRRQLRRRRRGRLRKLYDMWNAITSLLLLLIPSSLIIMVNMCIISLSKFYRYMIVFMSNRLISQLLWIIGIAVAVTILPINLVNATSSSLFSSSSLSSSEFDDNKDDFDISYYNNTTINITGTTAATNVTEKKPLFPPDLFTREQLENGAVVFYIIGVIYMFVALAIVCDEFFVPSLDVIIEKLDITDDVAGATFMAAGGSAPELFTSVIGVFVSFDDVGIGTIVGSAVFNILFVIGMCALFSKTVLSLTWWPLFRDCSFYSVSLLILICFFRDNLIQWWEALVLFFIYVGYVGFMKWNQQVERCVKKVVYKNKGNAANSSETSMATQPGGSVTSRAASETRSGPPGSSSGATGNSSTNAGSTVTGAKFRHGLLQLMIHTIDPLHDGKVDEKATQLHAIASLKVLLDATKPQRGAATTSAANHVKINLKETTLASDRPNGNIDTTIDSGNDLEEEPEALSMSWPDTGRKRITYLLVAPIVFPLWLTLPDTRTPRGKRFFPVTFIGSIVWIAAYSYLMVWWANVAGDTARIPPEVMGLTFLAAGTSIPDLITSVIVARKGFGDMAVSSSVGSNIFDVTVGLPIPWLLYGIIYQQPVEVNSHGMVCSITILFMMLLFVVMSIACFRWRMNKGLGLTMFLLYFVFVAVSLMFEYNIITCPV